MSKVFKGLDCKDGTPQPQSPADVADNLGILLNNMGTKNECVREADTLTRNSAVSGGYSGRMDVLGGLAGSMGVSGNFQSSSAELDNKFRESGCGSILMDSKKVFDSMRNINCTLNQSSSESSIATSGSASVRIRVVPIPGALEKLKAMRNDTLEAIKATKEFPELSKILVGDLKLLSKSISTFGTINILNSKVSVSANTKIRNTSKNIAQMASKVQADVENIVQASAENKLQQSGGTNAMQGSIKSLVNQEIRRQQDNIQSDIVQSLSRTDVSVDMNGNVEILAPMSINLVGTEVSANVSIDIATTALTSSAVDLGKSIATKLLTQATSKSETSMENKGLDDLARVINEGNANAIKGQMDALVEMSKTSMAQVVGMLVAGVAVLGVAAVGAKTMGGENGVLGGKGGIGNKNWGKGVKWPSTNTARVKMAASLTVKALVCLIVGYNLSKIVRNVTDLKTLTNPTVWKDRLAKPVIYILVTYVAFTGYCMTVKRSFSTLSCFLK